MREWKQLSKVSGMVCCVFVLSVWLGCTWEYITIKMDNVTLETWANNGCLRMLALILMWKRTNRSVCARSAAGGLLADRTIHTRLLFSVGKRDIPDGMAVGFLSLEPLNFAWADAKVGMRELFEAVAIFETGVGKINLEAICYERKKRNVNITTIS